MSSKFNIINRNSDLVLDIPDPPSNSKAKSPGTIVQQWKPDDPPAGANQQWKIVRNGTAGAGGYKILNVYSNLVLGSIFIPPPWVAQGAMDTGDDSSGSAGLAQEWYFVPVSANGFLITCAGNGLVLDVPDPPVHSDAKKDGTKIQLFAPNSGLNQQWRFGNPKGHTLPSITIGPEGEADGQPFFQISGTGFGADAGQNFSPITLPGLHVVMLSGGGLTLFATPSGFQQPPVGADGSFAFSLFLSSADAALLDPYDTYTAIVEDKDKYVRAFATTKPYLVG